MRDLRPRSELTSSTCSFLALEEVRTSVRSPGSGPQVDKSPSDSGQMPSAPARRRKAAESVVAQSKRAAAQRGNVVELDEVRLQQTKLIFGMAGPGSIRAEFPHYSGEAHSLDLSFLSEAPRLAKPLAEGFRVYGVGKRPKSLMGRRSELQTGFIPFLRESGLLQLELRELDRSVWNLFKQWLDNKPNPARPGLVIEPKTRSMTFGAAVAVIRALRAVSEYRIEANRACDCLPSVLWSAIEIKTAPRARLKLDELKALDAAVSREIAALSVRVDQNEERLKAGRAKLLSGNRDFGDLSVCVAYIADNFANGLPAQSVLRVKNPDLFRAINPCTNRIGASRLGVKAVVSSLYPTARDLVPFVLRVAIETGLNAVTALQLARSDVTYSEILGDRVARIGGRKWRSDEDPSIPVPAANIEPVLVLLERITEIVRRTAPEVLSERLFLFRRAHGNSSEARAFSTNEKGLPISDNSWSRELSNFCRDNDLPAFDLSQIRSTLSDEIAYREGIVVAGSVLGHRDPATTESHYVSDGTRWREMEFLGKTIMVMHRWYATEGKIDPRRRRLTSKMDRGAATPGFHCFDPYDSPIPNQRKNRLCTAYGRCPSCPLAAADISDPFSVALYHALRTSIYESQGLIAAQAWRERYAPALVDLDGLLSHVPPHVAEVASRVHVKLPMVE